MSFLTTLYKMLAHATWYMIHNVSKANDNECNFLPSVSSSLYNPCHTIQHRLSCSSWALYQWMPIIFNSDIPQCNNTKLSNIVSLGPSPDSLAYNLSRCYDIFQFSPSRGVSKEIGLSFPDASKQLFVK